MAGEIEERLKSIEEKIDEILRRLAEKEAEEKPWSPVPKLPQPKPPEAYKPTTLWSAQESK